MVSLVLMGNRLLEELTMIKQLRTLRGRLARTLAHPNGLFIDKAKEELYNFLWSQGQDVEEWMTSTELLEVADGIIHAHNYA